MDDIVKETSYDRVPYEGLPYRQSHPDRLATMGHLFGLSTAPVAQCRVLELGCGDGGNLIPMAYHLPDSEFVGVDLSERQVKMGCQMIQDLGLQNIRMETASVLDVDTAWGTFDYIIAHGVYSWVGMKIQDKILSISSDNLAPEGVAYVSYNTYPGWHIREMIREMMIYHANQFAEPKERIQQARALIAFLSTSVPTENNPYGLLLKKELDILRRAQDSLIFHDYLERVNSPVYFHQFVEQADRHGLQYLSEADFGIMVPSIFPKEVAETLQRISPSIINSEQYMDYLRNRHFRQTLLCHKGATLKRDIGPGNFTSLLVASHAAPAGGQVNLLPDVNQTFSAPNGATVQASRPLTKAALSILYDNWPRALDQGTLFQETIRCLQDAHLDEALGDEQEDRQALAGDLLNCYTVMMVEFRTWQADFVTEVSEKPRVSDLAAYQVKKGRPVVSQRHELINIDPFGLELVSLLDGTRDCAELVKRLSEVLKDTAIKLDGPTTRSEMIENGLKKPVDEALTRLAQSAMLVG